LLCSIRFFGFSLFCQHVWILLLFISAAFVFFSLLFLCLFSILSCASFVFFRTYACTCCCCCCLGSRHVLALSLSLTRALLAQLSHSTIIKKIVTSTWAALLSSYKLLCMLFKRTKKSAKWTLSLAAGVKQSQWTLYAFFVIVVFVVSLPFFPCPFHIIICPFFWAFMFYVCFLHTYKFYFTVVIFYAFFFFGAACVIFGQLSLQFLTLFSFLCSCFCFFSSCLFFYYIFLCFLIVLLYLYNIRNLVCFFGEFYFYAEKFPRKSRALETFPINWLKCGRKSAAGEFPGNSEVGK